jgi:flagellin
MRINTNVSALNTQRVLGQTNAAVSKQIGRLSSGFRINSAADDAAGLGIANKLRNDVRSLQQASRNAEQATAMLQVAEGATSTVASILDRMKELAAQSASSNSGDRTALQSEFSTLRDEITRIVATTKYQGTALVDGTMGNSFDAANSSIDANAAVQVSTIAGSGAAGTYTLAKVDATHVSATDGSGNVQVATVAATGAQSVSFDRFGISFSTAVGFDISGNNDSFSANASLVVAAGANAAEFLVSSSGSYGANDLVTVGSAINLATSTLGISTSDLSTQGGAQTALASIDSAVSVVNSALSTIGATQNRIDFALSSVKATTENFSAAQSTIRDADMAMEMTELSRAQILQQAGTAMLAQANQAPQSILSLLR